MNKVKPIAKAVVSGVVAFCGGLGVALTDGSVTGVEWCVIVPATVIAVGGVFGITNAPPED
jgi:hypothetical protein